MKIIGCLLFVMLYWTAGAQKQVRNFSLTNVNDGSNLSLDDLKSSQGIAIIFTSNSCPYDGYYQARIRNLINDFQGKIQFLLINSYNDPDESLEKMKAAFGQWNLPVPYLADKEQVAMNELGARKSPEAFLLKFTSGNYTLVYAGALDDNPQMAQAVSQPYLKTAIDRLLAGKSLEVNSTRTVGCTIRAR